MARVSRANEAGSRFRLLSRLGSGSHGVVHEALDARTGEVVAIKELGQIGPETIAHMQRVARALADLHHPNLVERKELIEADSRWYVVMELVGGHDFTTYVHADERAPGHGMFCDEVRLRTALLGIAQGLAALHEHGVLHRDLKPANVRVTPDGRAVLLDFGLVTDVDVAKQALGRELRAIDYLAPEQGTTGHVGPAADWYALGVCLFEALTGERPFAGTSVRELVQSKLRRSPPRPSALVPNVPLDLDDLCVALLERDPAARPHAAHVLQVLANGAATESNTGRAALLPASDFVGRDSELRRLDDALEGTRRGALRVVLVEGTSGVGKTALVAEFVRRARAVQPALHVLEGSCRPHAQAPYAAFEDWMHALSELLGGLPDAGREALRPPHLAAAGVLFPVLREVPTVREAPCTALAADPVTRRAQGVTALAALLEKLAAARPLVLTMDDLQWSDEASSCLLEALLEDASSLAMLLVATLPPREELDSEQRARMARFLAKFGVETVPLAELPSAQSRTLAARLLTPRAPHGWLDIIVRASAGHPALLLELVRAANRGDIEACGATRLDEAVAARIERLDPPTRSLLDAVALAQRPYDAQVFARALALPSIEEQARVLLGARLLRLRRGHELTTHHDCVRQVALRALSDARRAVLHGRLAVALSVDAELPVAEQARHADLAGDRERAIDAYGDAGSEALARLAFRQAARLSGRALELLSGADDPRRAELLVQRADALLHAGAPGDAAGLYRQASALSDAATSLRLRASAARALAVGGAARAGFDAARGLLREVGVQVPTGMLATRTRLARDRAWLALTSSRYPEHVAGPEDRKARVRYTLIERLLPVIATLSPAGFVMLSVELVRLADRYRIPDGHAQAHTLRGALHAAHGRLAAAVPRFERGSELCEVIGDPALGARQATLEGAARLVGGDFLGALRCLEHAEALAQFHVSDPALLADVRSLLGCTWLVRGAYARLARESARWLDDAQQRHDERARTLLSGVGQGYLRHLMQDAPERALAELDASIGGLPTESSSLPHLGHAIGTQITLISRGGADALRWLDARTALHRRVQVFRLGVGRGALRIFRCLALLAAAVAEPAMRTRRLREARRLAGGLARDRVASVRAHGQLVLAQLALLDGDDAKATHLARAARESPEACAAVTLHGAQYLTELIEDRRAREDARTSRMRGALRDEGWREPMRLLCIALPVLSLLEGQAARTAGVPLPVAAARPPPSRDVAAPPACSPTGAGELFVGREPELRRLCAAFESHGDDGPRLLFVQGDHGVGKSALLGALGRRLAAEHPGVVVLGCRCHARDARDLRVFDAAAAQLASVLSGLTRSACEAVLPEQVGSLAALFPALAAVPAIAHASRGDAPSDLEALRHTALDAFISLLGRLTVFHEVVFLLDDLQWADEASFRMLQRLLAAPDVPVWIVCTIAPQASLSAPAAAEIAQLRGLHASSELNLRGLPEEALRALTPLLSEGLELDQERVERASGGNPLLLRVLLSVARQALPPEEAPTLEQALSLLHAALPTEARGLLSLTALAGRPYPVRVFARALRHDVLPEAALGSLIDAGLVQLTADGLLSCDHGLVRRVVLSDLAPSARRELALRLGMELEADPCVDAAERARLAEEAGARQNGTGEPA